MNIIKIQDELRSVPDQALVGYVQNPSGHVPTYLALSELQRRKEMRDSYQANKPEEKSVAEDLVQESQPQQPGVMGLPAGQPMQQAMAPQPEMPTEQMAQGGLANLDTGNMYTEDSFATGGIVAFDDGGRVKHHGRVTPYVDPDREGQFDAAQYLAGADVGSDRFNLGADMAGMVNKRGLTDPRLQALYANYETDEGNKYGARYNPDARQASFERTSREGNRLGLDVSKDRVGVSGEYTFADGGSIWDKIKFGFASPDEMRAMQNTTSSNPFMGGMPPADRDPMTLQYERKALYDQLQDPNADKQSIYNRINEVDSRLKDPYGVGGAAPAKKEEKAAPPVPPKKEEKPGVAPVNPYDALLTKNKSLSEFKDDYKNALGDDPASKRLSDRLAKMDAAAAKQEEQAPWLALAKAGFAMADQRAEYGKAAETPFASIARGAGVGLKDYAEAKEALNKLEEKRFTIDNELAKQARAEQVAAVNYGVNSKQHIDEQNKTIQLAKIKDQTARELAAMENNTKLVAAMSKGAWDKKDFFKAYNEVAAGGVSPTYDKWKKEYIDNNGERSVTTADFRNKSESLIKEIINSQSSTASTPTIDTSGVKFLSLE